MMALISDAREILSASDYLYPWRPLSVQPISQDGQDEDNSNIAVIPFYQEWSETVPTSSSFAANHDDNSIFPWKAAPIELQ